MDTVLCFAIPFNKLCRTNPLYQRYPLLFYKSLSRLVAVWMRSLDVDGRCDGRAFLDDDYKLRDFSACSHLTWKWWLENPKILKLFENTKLWQTRNDPHWNDYHSAKGNDTTINFNSCRSLNPLLSKRVVHLILMSINYIFSLTRISLFTSAP